MKNIALLVIFTVSTLGVASKAKAADSCEERFNALNDRFNTAYFELDGECYPEDVVQSGMTMCYQMSDECRAKYDQLWNDYSAAYNELLVECSDVVPEYSIDVAPMPAARGVPRTTMAPRKKTPTKKELSKQVQDLKVKLRRSQTRLRKVTRSCSKK